MHKISKQKIADDYKKVKEQMAKLQIKLNQKRFDLETYCKTKNLNEITCLDGSVITLTEKVRKTTDKNALIAKYKPTVRFLNSITKKTSYTEISIK
jgi:hypothetical protein